MLKKITTMAITVLMMTGILRAVTIHTIGDSTMANYDESTTDKRGWGMELQQFFTGDAIINNKAKAGASSKSFYNGSAYWGTVKNEIKTGDYVLIQFAHNDETNNGIEGDSMKAKLIASGGTVGTDDEYRGTNPTTTYKDYLRKYVTETRALSATPILVAPIARKYFSGSTIKRSGLHDLGDSYSTLNDNGTESTGHSVPSTDDTYDYVAQMKAVAEEMNVPFIDLTTATAELYQKYGEAYCTSNLFCNGDNTHLQLEGAVLVARRATQLLKDAGLLTSYINLTSSLSVNPTSADLGKAYKGQTLRKELSVSGFDLTPTEGSVSVTAPEGFMVSTSKDGIYQQSLTFNYTGGNITSQKLYVSCELTEAGTKTGTVTITSGTMKAEVTLKAECVELTGGSDVTLNWPLVSSSEAVVTGPAEALDETASGMNVPVYVKGASKALWPQGYNTQNIDKDTTFQISDIEGGTWPGGEEDEISTRYIQFGIKANAGTTLHIDSIGCYIVSFGGNNMGSRVSYSKDADFSNHTEIAEQASMVKNQVYAVEATPVIELAAGETLYIRFYPWLRGSIAATGKTFGIKALTIHGSATVENAGVENATIDANKKIEGVWTIDGKYLGKTILNLPAGAYIINGEKKMICK